MVSDRITFGGIASGLDTNKIIDQLIAIQERPILKAEARRFGLEQKRDALADVNTSLSSLLSAAAGLKDGSVVGARGTSVTSGVDDSKALTASASSSAAIGSFSLDIVSLAKPTRVASASALGQPIAAGVPLDEAGFGVEIVPGTFTIDSTEFTIPAGTASTAASASAVGATVDRTVPLASAGLGIAPSATGTFEINGESIAFDSSVDSLDAIIARIDSSNAGVTATFDVTARELTLTAKETGSAAITYSDTAGNFLEAMTFVAPGTGTPIATETAGSALMSLNDVITMINTAGIGVTASLAGNLLTIAADDGLTPVELGAGGDTSNLLEASRLLESPSGVSRTSVRGLGVASLNKALDDARLATAITAGAGSFKVNGVEIAYDTTVDSLQNVIERINQSAAGVTALYDTYADKLVLTQEQTGSTKIKLEPVAGNFLIATGLLGATQSLGSNASYRIDGGPLQYATSNIVTDAVQGVTLTFRDTTSASMDVSVFSDSSVVKGRIETLVKEYNALMAKVRSFTQFNEDGPNGLLFGDQTLRFLDRNLRQQITGSALGATGALTSLASLGLTFGAVGSEVGTTDKLSFNAATFDQALLDDPEGVRQLLTAFEATAALDGGGSGSIASISGKPTNVKDSGTYEINAAANGDLTVTFRPDNGSAPIISTGFIAAGGTNSTIIPGVTLTAKDPLVAGVDTITITAQREGAGKALAELIDGFTRTGGLMETRQEEFNGVIGDINDQIERMNARVETRRAQLIRRFTALETTIAQLQSQQNALSSLMGQLSANSAAGR